MAPTTSKPAQEMKTITVNVTQEDIEKGETCCTRCPVAKAINRATKQRWRVSSWLVSRKKYSITPPPEVSAFIENFDARLGVHPFSFQIEIPE